MDYLRKLIKSCCIFPLITLAFVSCGTELKGDKNQVLTVYSGRSESLVGPLIRQFRETSGIDVRVKYGDTAELAATIMEEGKRTPADIFYVQDPAGLGAVEHMLSPLPDDIMSMVDQRFRSGDNRWVGISGRARTVAYNTGSVSEADLPDDIWDFTEPEWNGRIGWAPTNGSFQAMVAAMRELWGEEKTTKWLEGIRDNNPRMYPNNTSIVAAVGAGEVAVGFVNHYYLFRFLEDHGADFPVRNYHPEYPGPGSLILVSGAGIMEYSGNGKAAQDFIRFLLSPASQQYFADQTYEYPLAGGVYTNPLIKPLGQIDVPELDLGNLDDLRGTISLLRQTGIIP